MERNSHIVVIFGEGICCSSVPGCYGVCHAFSTCILGCVRHSQTSLPLLSLAPKFVPPCCRSASSWTGDGRLGEPCSYRQLREGTGSERCHIPFWGTYEPCRFSTREVRMDVYDWQGCINRLQNSSFFSTTIFVPARAERNLLRLSREQPKMRFAKKSNLCADP